MGMNQTPSSERVHIGIFGKRNAGKSSVMNAVTNQALAVVSDIKGTTTDPVYKAMELLPLGPVVIIDTPGLDDTGQLGEKRVEKSYQVLRKTDIALLIIDAEGGMQSEDLSLLARIKERKIPFIIVINKADLCDKSQAEAIAHACSVPVENIIEVSAKEGTRIVELRKKLAELVPAQEAGIPLIGDLIKPMDFVVLVIPVDAAAPKGRLILPQQQVIRALLEAQAVSIVVKETELADTLEKLGRNPDLVITDSQAFALVSRIVPPEILLTSFSVLFARYKGNLRQAAEGVSAAAVLQDGDKVLIAEGCTHHTQCDDIGTVKIPRWLKQYTKKEIVCDFVHGTEFPNDLSAYKLVIHCGGCMLNEKEVKYRLALAKEQGIPMTNYGIFIAEVSEILGRSLEVFQDKY